jgi:hypothetical protein
MVLSDVGDHDSYGRVGVVTTARGDSSPVAARVVLLSVEHEPNDLAGFMQEKTRVGTIEELLVREHGSKAARYIRYFIDNRPIGSEKEPELKSLEGDRVHPDSVLRVDYSRFHDEIPSILEENRAMTVDDKGN